jgi:hypothetical protein
LLHRLGSAHGCVHHLSTLVSSARLLSGVKARRRPKAMNEGCIWYHCHLTCWMTFEHAPDRLADALSRGRAGNELS